MKAALYDRYGGTDVLSIREVPTPKPGRRELLVRVRAAALNPKDLLVRAGKLRVMSPWGFPQGVGYDWAGEVVACGTGVTRAREGDALYGMLQLRAGACAEYAVVREDQCAPKPDGLDFEHAAAMPLAALTALQALRDLARVERGSRVLVNGASGGVGVFAVQIAKALGAHVTTTSSAANLGFCRELGADEPLDYARVDALATGALYDAVFDVFGNRRYAQARRSLTPRGTFVSTVLRAHVFGAIARTLFSSRRARLVLVRSRRRDLDLLAGLVRQGKVRPVLDHVFPLEEIAAAEDRLATKHARGKVVVRVA
jgi:NADPH:quinone reductase-like Zn-dependent oxidoreductase